MIIAKAQIAMAASHDYREEHQINESLTFWLSPKASETKLNVSERRWTTQVEISAQGLELQRSRRTLDLNTPMDSRSRINLMVLQHLYEAITGRPMQMADPAQLQPEPNLRRLEMEASDLTPPNAQPAPAPRAGYGLIYERQEHYHEQEKVEFKADGVINTEDGRTINFSSSLSMSRDYVEESNFSLRAGDTHKIDPLVINFDGKGVQLSQTRFKFDLDSDGNEEQLASLRPGSGFLAFDRNNDGQINDGSELFGPRSGQGFEELAQFDEDGNHFIDEGDSIYQRLRIWSFNEDGTQQLAALGDKNIGAIFLGHVSSPFQLKDEQNQSLGEVVSSGVYLTEDGKVGAVQQINLTA